MKRILIIFVLCFAYTMTLAQGAGGNRASDSLALVALYRSTDGPNWMHKWKLMQSMNTWDGVNINDEDRVDTLVLSFNELNGFIPRELGNLRKLDYLDLSSNDLNGSIPRELGQLSELTALFLNTNQLSGSIPIELGKLIQLTILTLSSNQLSGPIPSELGQLRQLTGLPLHINQLSGSIPRELGNLIQLRALNLHKNQLDGSIPSELGQLIQLTRLTLDSNQLSGSIPSELGMLIQLTFLTLNSNQLSGSIPSELGQLRQLTFLTLNSNQLSGSIPSELGQLRELNTLTLHSNQLSGSIPSELGNLSKLTRLTLDSNKLSGPIPSKLGQLSELTRLFLNFNQLSGSIPSELGNLIQLTRLNLSNNFFTELPDLGILSRRIFEVQTNYLDFGDLLPNITRLTRFAPQRPVREGVRYDLTRKDELLLSVNVGGTDNQYQWYKDNVTIMNSNNDTFRIANVALSDSGLYHCEITNPGVTRLTLQFTLQSIADTVRVRGFDRTSDSLALVALYRSTDGPNWRSKWNLMQPINRWFGVNLNGDNRVATLQLLSNRLRGSIPSELGNLSELTLLNLNSNELNGSIPSELGNLDQLQYLNLADNQLTGSIPPELGDLAQLERLILRDNQLSGSIPPELGDLAQLERLILRNNQLTGSIPPELGDLAQLKQLILRNNQLTGSIPPELGDLAQLQRLILRDNLLTDTIPKELGKLTNLYLLNLARNSLTGTIPPQLSNFPRMRNFVLSSNKLSGAIPEELRNLTTLWQLRLYDNFFTSLPDLSHINLPDAFEVYLNHLDFEDMLPNLSRFRPFDTLYTRYRSYNPQRPLREGEKYELSEGDDLVLRINKVKGENNRYQWYKNDIPISNARDTSISLTNVNIPDAGLYYCRVTHPRFGITFLRSSEDTVVVDGVTNFSKLTDSLVLVRLYESTEGATWTNSWNLTNSMDTWHGVSLMSLNGKSRVTRIDLNSNNLVGTIPRELSSLDQLQYLNLADNQLSDSIPRELGSLYQLQYLDLADNQLSDAIPPELGDLAQLQRLILRDNLLTDTIPKELGKLTNLVLLNLARNSLTGTIPPQLSNFPRMRNFVLSSNKLSGAIPEELRNLTKLSQLRLYDNFFTSLPDLSHINFPDAFEVYLNHLDFEDILPNLSVFRPFETLPRHQSYNPQRPLREGEKYELSEGDDLVLRINKVKGENNRYQWYKNDIPISNARDTSISLTNVNIPDAGLYYCRVTHPRFGITFLRSSEDTVVVDGVTNLSKLTDSLALVALYNSTDGANWTNSWNLADSSINTWYGVTLNDDEDRVATLGLSSNNLNGSIPSELGNLDQLQYLNLADNQLSDAIPPELGDLAQLERLILRDNQLSGSIPLNWAI